MLGVWAKLSHRNLQICEFVVIFLIQLQAKEAENETLQTRFNDLVSWGTSIFYTMGS